MTKQDSQTAVNAAEVQNLKKSVDDFKTDIKDSFAKLEKFVAGLMEETTKRVVKRMSDEDDSRIADIEARVAMEKRLLTAISNIAAQKLDKKIFWGMATLIFTVIGSATWWALEITGVVSTLAVKVALLENIISK